MDCLVGFIGLASSIGVSGSGLYLNTLPNITILSTNKIADSDQIDQTKVMADIETRAINRFRTQFIIERNKCWRVSKRNIAECLICENREILAVALQYLMAAELMTERINSERINRFTTIDRMTAQKSRVEFEEIFYTELHVAVLGIDIQESDCFEHLTENNCLMKFDEFTP